MTGHEKNKKSRLTANRPLIHTCFTYPKLNMGDFSVQSGPLGHGDSTKFFLWNSLHAAKGIGKGKGFGIIHICCRDHKTYIFECQAFVA